MSTVLFLIIFVYVAGSVQAYCNILVLTFNMR